MSRPKRRRHLDGKVRAVADALRRNWDPIGQGYMPDLPADEYDSYAPHIVFMLEGGFLDSEIAEHLKELEDRTIGAGSGLDLTKVAGRLRAVAARVAPSAT